MTNDNRSEREADVRGWIANLEAQAERERELPQATCRMCGGTAKAGEGRRDPERDTSALYPDPLDPSRMTSLPPMDAPRGADDWRRVCGRCDEAPIEDLVGMVAEIPVTEDEARAVVARMTWRDARLVDHHEFPWRFTTTKTGRRPWAHVSKSDRARVRAVLADVRTERIPGPSELGACALCGVREHIDWTEAPLSVTWPDGSPCAVCGDCEAVLDRFSVPDDLDAVRTLATIAATGSDAYFWAGAPAEFRIYAETRDADRAGMTEAWSYGPGIEAFREETWLLHPDSAPEDRRAEFEAKLADMIAANHAALRADADAQREAAW